MGFARTGALILLADDDADVREMYAAHLLLSGFAVLQARNGHDALSVARSCRPDVIVTDVEMPRMSGLQFARALRADPTMRVVPIICLSGLEGVGREAAEAGCTAIAMKPLAPESLAALVGRILGRQRTAAVADAVGHVPFQPSPVRRRMPRR